MSHKTRGTILRELIDYFLDAWLARESEIAAEEREFRLAVEQLKEKGRD